MMIRSFASVLVGSSLVAPALLAQHHETQESEPTAEFDAVHVERQKDITLNGTPDEVFAMFEPRGFQRWHSPVGRTTPSGTAWRP